LGAGASIEGSRDQSARAAAAVATGLPLTVITIVVALTVLFFARRLTIESELHSGPRPLVLRSSLLVNTSACAVLLCTVVAPIAALLCSLNRPLNPLRIWREFAPQMSGSMFLASIASITVVVLMLDSLRRQRRRMIIPAGLCFLIGGQMLAIGLIRLFNRDATAWVYDSFAIAIIAYVARFGWIALAAALATWQPSWVSLREMSAVDGANETQTLWRVVFPLAWPIVASAGLLVGVLSLTEVPATMLLSPQNPQPIVPLLMTWVHLQRYDAMIEGTLLLSAVVVAAAAVVVALVWIASTNPLRVMLKK
jgi:ABC-type Fe3+ transport system permease subunit